MLNHLNALCLWLFVSINTAGALYLTFIGIKKKHYHLLFPIVFFFLLWGSITLSQKQTRWENFWSDYTLVFPALFLIMFLSLTRSQVSRGMRLSLLLLFGLNGFFHYLPNFQGDGVGRAIRMKSHYMISRGDIINATLTPQHPFSFAIAQYYGNIRKNTKTVVLDNPIHPQEFGKLIGLENDFNAINYIFLEGAGEEQATKKVRDFLDIKFFFKNAKFGDEQIYYHPYGPRANVKVNAHLFIKK